MANGILKIKRTSDQSVEITFMSARQASEFQNKCEDLQDGITPKEEGISGYDEPREGYKPITDRMRQDEAGMSDGDFV